MKSDAPPRVRPATDEPLQPEWLSEGTLAQNVARLKTIAEQMGVEWRIMLAGREIERSPGFDGQAGSATFHLDALQ